MIREVAREFAEEAVKPGAAERDSHSCMDRRLFRQLGELGFAAIPLPEECGGGGAGFVSFAIVIEELSRACGSTGGSVAAHTSLAAWPLWRYGRKAQHSQLLSLLSDGKTIGGSSWLRPVNDSLSDPAPLLAEADNDGSFILSGTSGCPSNAGEADCFIVYAQMHPRKRSRTYSAFLVEKGSLGLTVKIAEQRLGLRAAMSGSLEFERCKVPAANLLGSQGKGKTIARDCLTVYALGIASQAVGIAQAALEAATSYAKERKQFGQPIGRQQGIAFKLADMASRVEASRLLVYQAAWKLDEKLPGSKDAAIACAFSADTAAAVTVEAVQIFGGYGYMREFEVERFMRDAKCLQAELVDIGIYSGIIWPGASGNNTIPR